MNDGSLTINCGLEFWELSGLINRPGWFDSNIRYSRMPGPGYSKTIRCWASVLYRLFKRQAKRLFWDSKQIDYNHHTATIPTSREIGNIEGLLWESFSVDDRDFGGVCDRRCAG